MPCTFTIPHADGRVYFEMPTLTMEQFDLARAVVLKHFPPTPAQVQAGIEADRRWEMMKARDLAGASGKTAMKGKR